MLRLLRGRVEMSRIAVGLASSFVLLISASGRAAFHNAVIDEVMSGVNGDSTAQYIEVRLLSAGQSNVCHTRLTVFKWGGGSQGLINNIDKGTGGQPCGVTNSAGGARWIMATPSSATFMTKSMGLPPNFVMNVAELGLA